MKKKIIIIEAEYLNYHSKVWGQYAFFYAQHGCIYLNKKIQ